VIETVLFLYQALSQKSHSIQRLLRRIFGIKTESAKKVLKDAPNPPPGEAGSEEAPANAPNGRDGGSKGHG
jgi:hypothetical protein